MEEGDAIWTLKRGRRFIEEKGSETGTPIHVKRRRYNQDPGGYGEEKEEEEEGEEVGFEDGDEDGDGGGLSLEYLQSIPQEIWYHILGESGGGLTMTKNLEKALYKEEGHLTHRAIRSVLGVPSEVQQGDLVSTKLHHQGTSRFMREGKMYWTTDRYLFTTHTGLDVYTLIDKGSSVGFYTFVGDKRGPNFFTSELSIRVPLVPSLYLGLNAYAFITPDIKDLVYVVTFESGKDGVLSPACRFFRVPDELFRFMVSITADGSSVVAHVMPPTVSYKGSVDFTGCTLLQNLNTWIFYSVGWYNGALSSKRYYQELGMFEDRVEVMVHQGGVFSITRVKRGMTVHAGEGRTIRSDDIWSRTYMRIAADAEIKPWFTVKGVKEDERVAFLKDRYMVTLHRVKTAVVAEVIDIGDRPGAHPPKVRYHHMGKGPDHDSIIRSISIPFRDNERTPNQSLQTRAIYVQDNLAFLWFYLLRVGHYLSVCSVYDLVTGRKLGHDSRRYELPRRAPSKRYKVVDPVGMKMYPYPLAVVYDGYTYEVIPSTPDGTISRPPSPLPFDI